jgi:outer membrane lipoprotein LolB
VRPRAVPFAHPGPNARTPRLLAALAALAITGCATAPQPPASEAAVPLVFSGRLALTVAPPPVETGPSAVRSASGLFELVGSASTGRLTLSTPLGATLAEARWSPQDARLVAPEGERHYRSLEALTTDLVGEPLPIGALFDWLGGRPAAGESSRSLPDSTGFEQFGWRVELERFADGRLRLAREGRVRVELRLVIDAAPRP